MRALNLVRKAGTTAVLALLAGPVLAGTAHADDTSAPLPRGDLSAAVAAAHTSQGLGLVRDAAHAADVRQGSARKAARTTTTAAPVVARQGVAVYGLSPEFVAGHTRVPGRLWYVATDAATSAGHVTVFTAPDARGAWQAVNVATGDTETRMGRLAHGAPLLAEPQVSAWYAVEAGKVRPLNAAARTVVGARAVSLAAYQRIVAKRYGDKLPGSRYDDQGAAGGYDTSAPATPTEAASSDGGAGDGVGLLLPGVGVAALGGVLLVTARRPRRR